MRIVIATAEPRGAYHLAPLAAHLAESRHHFAHLIPYPEDVQGPPLADTTSDLDRLATADRLVITGGNLNAWTLAVAWRATSLGVPVVFSELAYVACEPSTSSLPAIARVSALSPSGADALARYLTVPLGDITVTGSPALDDAPRRDPLPGRILVVSTAGHEGVDPDDELMRLALELMAHGRDVRVLVHPREDPRRWEGFELAAGATLPERAGHAAVAVGYPGSATPLIAALGVPFVALDPVNDRLVLPAAHRAAASVWTTDAQAALAALDAELTVPHAFAAQAVGPIGGAGARIVHFWTAAH